MSERGKGEECHWCERTLEAVTSLSRLAATRDHVIPKSRGGQHTVWACRQCNALKADMTIEEWVAFMKANPKWWTIDRYQRGTLIRHSTSMKEAVRRANASTDPRIVITANHRTRRS